MIVWGVGLLHAQYNYLSQEDEVESKVGKCLGVLVHELNELLRGKAFVVVHIHMLKDLLHYLAVRSGIMLGWVRDSMS